MSTSKSKESNNSHKKNKKHEEFIKNNENSNTEVFLYIPVDYKYKVMNDKVISRLKELVSFTYSEHGKNILKFTPTNSSNVDKVRSVVNVLEQVYRILSEYNLDSICPNELESLLKEYFKYTSDADYIWTKDVIFQDVRGKYFTPRTENQKLLVDSMRKNIVTIVEGSAGTGKSRIALVMGLNMLRDNRVDKIIVIRPMVAVGDDIGYLPGGIDEKIDPYQSPISEALIELIGLQEYKTFIDCGKIVLYPASFARGCNISDSFVIVDEAQNFDQTTLLTLLTRICGNTKMVFTGDSSQDDRKNKHREQSGLRLIKKKLDGVENISIIEMGLDDIQRSKLVRDIISVFQPTGS